MDRSITHSDSARRVWTTDDVREKITKSKVVVFAKGNAEKQRCGFSKQAITAIRECEKPCEVVDVSGERSISAALRVYSGHSDLPLVFVEGKLVSSLETLPQMLESGELKQKVESAFSAH